MSEKQSDAGAAAAMYAKTCGELRNEIAALRKRVAELEEDIELKKAETAAWASRTADMESKLIKIQDLNEGINVASDSPCTCSGFTIQYEGGCQCDKSRKCIEAQKAFWDCIESLNLT